MYNQRTLEAMIIKHNDDYRLGISTLTDTEFDGLMDMLKRDYPKSKLLRNSILEVAKSRKEAIPMEMYSLDKEKSIEEVQKWVESKNIEDEFLIITPKFDGISLVSHEESKVTHTRGDGKVGQNSTMHYANMKGYSDNRQNMYSFGEAIMSKFNFEKYKEEYSNPRNFVAGIFGRDEMTPALKDVDYIRYGSSLKLDKYEQLDKLNALFNSIKVDYVLCKISDINKKMLDDIYIKWSHDFKIDGVVIEVNSHSKRESLGRENNNNPAYAIAYKNPEWNIAATVKVLGITIQVSKQGKMKPVINIETTEIGEVMVSNVAGYNMRYIFDNNIAKNSIIKVVRSGDVIPKHIETISFDEVEIENLKKQLRFCPCCGAPLCFDENKVEMECWNTECRDQIIGKLSHFFRTLEIDEFSEPSIIRFYDAGFKTPLDILEMTIEDMSKISGWGERSATKLKDQFKKLSTEGVPAAKFLDALDVMQGKLGEKSIQLIFDNISHDEMLGIEELNISKLLTVNGIAEISAMVFYKGLKESLKMPGLPIRMSYYVTPKKEIVGDSFKDHKICFTGCRPSDELQSKIESEGGEIVGGVSKNTTHLIVKDLSEKTLSSNKAVTAKKLGIEILTLETLKNK